jgi:hypothetical protein
LDGIGGVKGEFPPFGAPTELATGTAADFTSEVVFPGAAQGITEAQPDEVGELVGEDAGKLGGGAVQGDAPVAEKSAGMDGSTAVAEAGRAGEV